MGTLASSSLPNQPAFWTLRRRRLYAALALGAVLFGAEQSLTDWRDRHAFLINATQSLPNWAFLIDRGAVPKRGDYVFFDPPRVPLVVRHFGPRPPMFGKIVYGVGGDTVSRIDRTFFVDGRQVAVAKPISRLGEPLALGPVGRIPAGCYFVGSPHRDGLDSRYAAIGWPCQRQVIGTGTPIL
jgi:conjugal transfer pilin signal peptidase TrbI